MSYKKGLFAKNILQVLSLGNFERSYKFLSTYGKELLRAIPGIVFKVVVNEDLYLMRGRTLLSLSGFQTLHYILPNLLAAYSHGRCHFP